MPLTTPKISIIVPCYNSAAYIEETLKSIVAQKYPALELIVIDGGSTDGTQAIIEKFRPQLAYYVSEKDKGQSDAILKGFARATGEWIAWCNADDTYYPGSLEAAAFAILNHPEADAVYGTKDYVDALGGYMFTAQNAAPSIFTLLPFPHIFSEALLVRRSIVAEEGITINPARHHLMDGDWFLRLYWAGKKFVEAPGFKATFRQHADAKSSKQAHVSHKEAFELTVIAARRAGVTPAERTHLIGVARTMLLNFWGVADFKLLHKSLGEALSTFGAAVWTSKLFAIALASLLPASLVKFLKILPRKLLTRPIWLWERFISRRVHTNPFALPSLELRGARETLVVLTTPMGYVNAAWTAYSLLKNLGGAFGLTLVVDGALPEGAVRAKLETLFRGIKIISTAEAVEALAHKAPHLTALAARHPMGRKMATLLYLNAQGRIVFSDDDILAFKPLDEIMVWAKAGSPVPLFIQEAEVTTRHDEALKAAAEKLGLKAPARINVGLLALPQATLKLETVEAILAQATPNSWFPDTTLIAYQLAHGTPLPMPSYRVSVERQFYFQADVDYTKLKLRHFVGPVRHLLRLKGVRAFMEGK